MSSDEPAEHEQKLLKNIETYGWQCNNVFDPDGVEPDFSYSVGFAGSLGSPEFIIFGLRRELMQSMLASLYDQIKAGATVEHDKRWSDLLEGYECVSKRATAHNLFQEYTTVSKWLWNYQGNKGSPEIYQIVWPGAVDGLFPWDEGCDDVVRKSQPQLW